MAKISLKGWLVNVGDLVEVGANRTIKQSVIIKVPGWVDQFGEKKGRDEYWEADMLNDAIDKFNIRDHQKNAKVEVELYVNSSWYENKETGKTGCIVNVRLASIKFLDNVAKTEAPAPVDVSAVPGEDDDLPF